MSLASTVINIILLPVYVLAMAVFLVGWFLCTITGIGPILQHMCNRSDKKTLDRNKIAELSPSIRIINVPGNIHSCSESKPYSVFAIFSEPKDKPSQYPPVCIPNGLGATAILISQVQERLTELGFSVLSFDRLGVGLSDPNLSGQSPTAVDLVNEMEFLMSAVQPRHTKWILLGPSMGSIVAQCYISQYPDKVAGFLNMDGLPYPFLKFHSAFMWAGFAYRMYASITWTGVLRPFISMAVKANDKMFASTIFPQSLLIAQMNQSRFFSNVGAEMWTMMDCCEMANLAWGCLSVLELPPEHMETLVRAAPTVSIDFDDSHQRLVTTFRSPSEKGDDWIAPDRIQQTLAFMSQVREQGQRAARISSTASRNKETALDSMVAEKSRVSSADPLLKFDALEELSRSSKDSQASLRSSRLGEIWKNLVVRVMSARSHDFGNAVANSFYNQNMRDYAAAEHAVHMLLARNGARTNYPKLTHTVMFSKTDDIVRNMQEIAFTLEKNG